MWELNDGQKIHGPFSEAAMNETIRRGMPSTVMIRRQGEAEWWAIAETPFAAVLPPTPPVQMTPQVQILYSPSVVAVKEEPRFFSACGLLLILLLVLPFGACIVAGLVK